MARLKQDEVKNTLNWIEDAIGNCANPECVGDPDNYKPSAIPEKQLYKDLIQSGNHHQLMEYYNLYDNTHL